MSQRSESAEPACVPFQRPSLPSAPEIERYLQLSRKDRWFSNSGPCWRLLRDRLADRVGAYCVPVASGTLGLIAAIDAALERPPAHGSRSAALLPSFTFIATAQAALWCGLTPVLADIDIAEWHLDAGELERLPALRDDVAAVIAVSCFGTPPPAETRVRWEAACRAAGVPLVVDSAAGFGAVADDHTPIGGQGDIEVVSFHATKPFAIGEGGAVFTHSRAMRDRVELAINFGLRPDRSLGISRGLNAKMSELHAATALAVLDNFDEIVQRRRRAAAYLRSHSGPNVGWQRGCERSTWQFVPVAFGDADARVRAQRASAGRFEVRTYYQPLHRMDPYRSLAATGNLARTEDLCERILCLPMANDLSDAELQRIVAALAPDHAVV